MTSHPTYTNKQNAVRAAKAAAARSKQDYRIIGGGTAWTFECLPFETFDEVAPKEIERAAADAEISLTVTMPASPLFPAQGTGSLTVTETDTSHDIADGTDADDGHERGADEVLGGSSELGDYYASMRASGAQIDHRDADDAQAELDAAMGATGSEAGIDPRDDDWTPQNSSDIVQRFLNTCDARSLDSTRAEWLREATIALGHLRSLEAGQKAPKAPKAERTRTAPTTKPGTPTTTKPIINSPTNQVVARLVDKIEAARGDLAALEAMTFKAGNTYYAKAAAYRDGLIAEARAAQG